MTKRKENPEKHQSSTHESGETRNNEDSWFPIVAGVVLTGIFLLIKLAVESVVGEASEFWFIGVATFMTLITLLIVFNKSKNYLGHVIVIYAMLALLPFFHFLIYQNKANSYMYQDEMLNFKSKTFAEEVKEIAIDSIFCKIYNDLPESNKNLPIGELLSNRILKLENYDMILGRRNFIKRYESVCLYHKDGSFKASYPIELEVSFQELCYLYGAKLEDISTRVKEPEKYLHFGDIWLESVVGFLFGNITPVSGLAKLVRIIQIAVGFVFGLMMTGLYGRLFKG